MKRTPMVRKSRINAKRAKPRRKGPPVRQVAVKVLRDGRESCNGNAAGRREFVRRRELMWELDEGICCCCDTYVQLGSESFAHWIPRRAGGGFRDDRVSDGHKRLNGIAHMKCNFLQGSKTLDVYRAELGLGPRAFRMEP